LVGQRTVGGGRVASGKGPSRSTGAGISSRNLARGSAAVGAGVAALSGDAQALQDIGLSLAVLQAASPTERCQIILDQVLGAPGTVDDEILRRASLEALKEMFTAEEGPSPEQSLRTFLGAFVYQTALIELTSQHAAKNLPPNVVLQHEKELKQYIKTKVKFERIVEGAGWSLKKFVNSATSLAEKCVRLLGKKP
jgi:hypothetical protein